MSIKKHTCEIIFLKYLFYYVSISVMETLTNSKISSILGIPKSTWGMYVTGKRRMTHSLAKQIEVITGINHEFTLAANIEEVKIAIKAYCWGKV